VSELETNQYLEKHLGLEHLLSLGSGVMFGDAPGIGNILVYATLHTLQITENMTLTEDIVSGAS